MVSGGQANNLCRPIHWHAPIKPMCIRKLTNNALALGSILPHVRGHIAPRGIPQCEHRE